MRVEFSRPKWLRIYNRKLTSLLRFYLAKRTANSGRPTFALYYTPRHKNNEGFLVPFAELIDVPVYIIREFLEDAVVGRKILKKLGKYTWGYIDEIEEAAEIGRRIRNSEVRLDLLL
jgi:hypothetical protein